MQNSTSYWASNQINVLIGLIIFVFISCKTGTSTVIFHTDFGEMTVDLLPDIPANLFGQLQRMTELKGDSIQVAKILHDGFLELGYNAPENSTGNGPALSGQFVWSEGRFYLIQGRKLTEADLVKWEKLRGITIAPGFRELYLKNGGTLQLGSKCLLLGKLIAGKEVLDRIAALPTDANGRPLQMVRIKPRIGEK